MAHFFIDIHKGIEPYRWTGTDWVFDFLDAYAEVYDRVEPLRRLLFVDGGYLLELAGEIVFLDRGGPFGGRDDHGAVLFFEGAKV